MIEYFTVKNVLSFSEETTLDLRAVRAYNEHPSNTIPVNRDTALLRVVSIYGANASGKSNLYSALNCFRRIVVDSANLLDQSENTAIRQNYLPYSFCDTPEDSEFEVGAICNDCRYTYGFTYNDRRIEKEWLYRRPLSTNRLSIILERDGNEVRFGASVRKECDPFRTLITETTLALSVLGKVPMKRSAFADVLREIQSMNFITTDNSNESLKMLQFLLPDLITNHKDRVIGFLRSIDTGILDIRLDDSIKKAPQIFTTHIGKNQKKYELRLQNESNGTLKALTLYLFLNSAIRHNQLIFVDELNDKLHPLLLKLLVDQFYRDDTTAQLVYTTHDTTLMDRHFFRRDQICFVQKDTFGVFRLYSLADFKVRNDASFESDYLAGVYGGIPKLDDLPHGTEKGKGR